MKKLITLGLILFSLSSNAEEWDLLQPLKESFYCIERNSTALTSRYEVDTLNINNDGSRTYFINYKYREALFAQCTEWNGDIFYGTQGGYDYLTIDSIHISQGIHTITYGTDTLQIDALAEVGESLDNGFFELTCLEKNYSTFLGTADSLKIYSINSPTIQDTLVLSKNYGLIESPYFFDLLNNMTEVSRLLLGGTEVNGVFEGKRSFDILEFIPYQAGDIIDMVYTSNQYIGYNTIYRDYITTYVSNATIDQNELHLAVSQAKTNVFIDDTNSIYDSIINPIILDTIIFDLKELQYGLDYDIHYYILGRPGFSLVNTNNNFSETFLVKLDQAFDFDLQKEKLLYTFYGTNIFNDQCDIATLSDTYQQFGLTHCYGETDRTDQNWVWSTATLELTSPPTYSETCSNDLSYCAEAQWEIAVPNNNLDFSSQSISIYPNPVKDYLFIHSDEIEIESISVINMNGKEMHMSVSTAHSIDVSILSSGIYYLQVKHSKGLSLEKFTKF